MLVAAGLVLLFSAGDIIGEGRGKKENKRSNKKEKIEIFFLNNLFKIHLDKFHNNNLTKISNAHFRLLS